MPSKSKAQKNLMAAASHNPAFAKKVGVPVSVAQEFNKADKGKKFGGGGMAKSDMKEDTKMDKAQDKAMIKKAFKQHDMQEHKGGKGTKLELKKGGKVKKMAMGGMMGNVISAASNAIANMPKTTTSAAAPSRPTGGIAPNIKSQLPARTGPVVTTGSAYNSKKPGTPFKDGGRIASKGEHAVQKKSKRGAEVVKMCGGGMKKYARGGGIEVRGKTKGKIC